MLSLSQFKASINIKFEIINHTLTPPYRNANDLLTHLCLKFQQISFDILGEGDGGKGSHDDEMKS